MSNFWSHMYKKVPTERTLILPSPINPSDPEKTLLQFETLDREFLGYGKLVDIDQEQYCIERETVFPYVIPCATLLIVSVPDFETFQFWSMVKNERIVNKRIRYDLSFSRSLTNDEPFIVREKLRRWWKNVEDWTGSLKQSNSNMDFSKSLI